MIDINVNNGIVARTIEKSGAYRTQLCRYDKHIPEQCAVLFLLAYTIKNSDETVYYVPESTFLLLDDLKFEDWMNDKKYEQPCEYGIYNVWESAIAGVKDLLENKDIRNSRDLYYRKVTADTEGAIQKDILLPNGETKKQTYLLVENLSAEELAARKLREKTIEAFRRRQKE